MRVDYIVGVDVDPTTLIDGTTYYSIYNSHTKNVYIKAMHLQTMSANGSGNSKCTFALARTTGTAPTGGRTMTPAKMATDATSVSINVKSDNTGLITTGSVISPYFMEIALRSGSEGSFSNINFNDDFVLAPGEGLVIMADGALIAGSSIHGSIEFSVLI
jgi:hypothetical protein